MKSLIFVSGLLIAALAVAASRGATEEPRQPEPEILVLPPLKIREYSTSDFGVSLLSNRDAASTGKIEWLIVSRVTPGSGAALSGLKPGDRILRVNGGTVTKLSKDRMLALFFRRKIGTRMQLEVRDPQTDAYRTVDLVCNEVHMENRPVIPPVPNAPERKKAP